MVFAVLLGTESEIELIMCLRQLLAVGASGEVGHLHHILLLVQERSVEQGNEEQHNGKQRHRTANHHGGGGNPAALGILLFLGLPTPSPAAFRMADLPAGGRPGSRARVSHHRTVSGQGSGGTLPGSGLNLLFRGGQGHPRRGNFPGGVVHQGVIVEYNGRIFPEFLHILKHFRGGNVPIPDFQCHGFHNDLLQACGNVGVIG